MKIGEIYDTKKCGKLKIIRRIECERRDLWEVEFVNTNFITQAYTHNIIRGSVNDPYVPRCCGVGYIGEMNKKADGHPMKSTWEGMLGRCYNHENKDYHRYKGTKVCDRWLNFSNFVEDVEKMPFYDQRIKHGGLKWSLDKDILGFDKKLYSPETCMWVPVKINSCVGGLLEMIKMGYVITPPTKEQVIKYIQDNYIVDI